MRNWNKQYEDYHRATIATYVFVVKENGGKSENIPYHLASVLYQH